MRSILFHCKSVESAITGLSTRPKNIVHGAFFDKRQCAHNCILVLLTVENGDSEKKAEFLSKEIIKFLEDTGHQSVFLCPFAHLSNNLASSLDAHKILSKTAFLIENVCTLVEGHFGSDKELLIHLFGHPGNARYREF
jgi:Archaea-specific editing domain of threonyl-tRNA synthetase